MKTSDDNLTVTVRKSGGSYITTYPKQLAKAHGIGPGTVMRVEQEGTHGIRLTKV